MFLHVTKREKNVNDQLPSSSMNVIDQFLEDDTKILEKENTANAHTQK